MHGRRVPPLPHPGPDASRGVAVAGGESDLGHRVLARLAQAGRGPVVTVPVPVPQVQVPVPGAVSELDGTASRLGGCDTLVLVDATSDAPALGRLLDEAASAGVAQVVLVSTATVYGAWPANPTPLTEEAPLRPNPGFVPAQRAAELERRVGEWAEATGGRVAVLRSAPVVVEGAEPPMTRALREGWFGHAGADEPRTQFVHVDDLAAAVILAVERQLDGPFNVAADHWIGADEVRALTGGRRGALRLGRGGRSRLVPGLLPYTRHPWVVATDRLAGEGWTAAMSNEEALVATHDGTPWSRLGPGRRQQLLLGGLLALVGSAVAVGAAMVGRRRQGEGVSPSRRG